MTDQKAPPPVDEPQKGPWTQTKTTTFSIDQPLKITITTKIDSSHVPPAEPGKGDSSLHELIQRAAQIIIARLDEIRAAQVGNDDMH